MSKFSAYYLLALSVLVMSQISSAADEVESIQINNHSKKLCSADNLTPRPKQATTPLASDKPQIQSRVIEFSSMGPKRRRSLDKHTANVNYPPTSMEAKVSTAATQFGLNFLNNLEDNRENTVFSPLSIQAVLNMILLGSDDNSSTQKELSKVLGYEKTGLFSAVSSAGKLKPHEASKSVYDIMSKYTNRVGGSPSLENVNFNLANLVLTNKDSIELKPDYERELKKYYSVNIDHFSANKSEQLEERVNKWVRNKTQNQIQNLVNDGELSDTLLVLINAAYFKGNWLHRFKESYTEDDTFYNDGKNEKKVKFMFMTETLGYANFVLDRYDLSRDVNSMSKEEQQMLELSKKLDCAVLSMPFSPNQGQEFSMVILLPAKKDRIEQLQKSLDAQTLNEVTKLLVDAKIHIKIPKFSLEASQDAKSILMNMGLNDVFKSPKFDKMFTSKTGQKGTIDKIKHKAKISVDENGAEAAAATVAQFVPLSFTQLPEFHADHPFLFIIRHSRTNMPLFMGRVNHL